jgi:hypothetical protein
MAKTSVHFQPCKEISEIHNYRKKKLDYVRTQLTNKNENWMWDSSKSLADRREEIRKLVKEKTGRKMQSKAVPLHEAVVVIDEKTTMDDLKKLGKIYQQRFGIECVHISIHRDEGHWINRNGEDVGLKPTDNPTQEQIIEGVTWKPNLHAHMVFDWYNHDNGKSWKTSKQDARDMQTIAAEVLSMGRGQESTKKHLDGLSYKIAQKMEETEVQTICIRNLQMGANILREQIGDNQEKLDEINRQKEEAERRRNAALKQAEELKEQLKLGSDWLKEQQVRTEEVKQSLAKELKQLEKTNLSLSEGLDRLSSINTEVNRQKAVREQINAEIRELDTRIEERKEELKKTNISISEGLDGLSSIDAEVNRQKAVREQINAEIKDFTARQTQQLEEYNKKAQQLEQLNEGISIAKEFDHRINTAFQSVDDSESLWGLKKYEAVQKECEKFNTELKNRCMRIEKLIDQAIEYTIQCIKDMRRKAYTEQEVSVINVALGKQRREERAMAILYAAEEDAGVRHGYYAGCAIWERDLKAIARGESVKTELDRGRGIGY